MENNLKEASVYIHIPFCNSKCSYCDFYSVTEHTPAAAVLEKTFRQTSDYLERFGIESVPTVYIGGGTPTSLPSALLEKLFDYIGNLKLSPGAEVTVEANPETVTSDLLSLLNGSAVNRLSLGIQSFDNRTLEILGRHCTGETAEKSLELIKKRWAGRLNLDFIASVPGQSPESAIRDLEKGLSFYPGHISLYALTIEEGTPIARRFDPADTGAWDESWSRGAEFLEQAGYRRYEISNFSVPGLESRHNIRYWKLQQYAGAGPGGVSTFYNPSGTGLIRLSGPQDIHRYLEADDIYYGGEREDVTFREHVFEYMMMGFRMTEGICCGSFRELFGKDIGEMIPVTAGNWKRKGLLRRENENIFLTPEGLAVLNPFLLEALDELSDS